MRGENVTVITATPTGVDEFNNPTHTRTELTVTDVLVAPTTTNDLTGSTRPDGKTTTLTLHFPKTFTGRLAGALVRVRGVEYRVVGNPVAYQTANTPTRWNRPVELEEVEG